MTRTNEQLADELDQMQALLAGMITALGSLVATHPNYAHFQLHLASMTELQLEGPFGQRVLQTDLQREISRQLLETLQQLKPVAPGAFQPYRPPGA